MSENEKQPGPLDLWNQVCTTDPSHTKKVDMRGGFTAIDPQHQLKVATSLWGPYGSAWGLSDLQWGMIEVADQKPTMTLDAWFFYPGGKFPISVDMSYRSNDDCRKKLRTAAQSKALALLGFNADIFLGQYDDEIYVQQMRTKFSDQDEIRKTILAAIKNAPTHVKLQEVRSLVDMRYRDSIINKTIHSEMIEAIERQKQDLQAEAPQTEPKPRRPKSAAPVVNGEVSDEDKADIRERERLEQEAYLRDQGILTGQESKEKRESAKEGLFPS